MCSKDQDQCSFHGPRCGSYHDEGHEGKFANECEIKVVSQRPTVWLMQFLTLSELEPVNHECVSSQQLRFMNPRLCAHNLVSSLSITSIHPLFIPSLLRRRERCTTLHHTVCYTTLGLCTLCVAACTPCTEHRRLSLLTSPLTPVAPRFKR